MLALSLCLAVALPFALTSCTDGTSDDAGEQETVYYTVKFNTVGGETIEPMRIAKGEKINKPISPTRENYIFVEWRQNSTPWDFSIHMVTSDITLTAHWVSADSVFGYEIIEGTENAHITSIKALPTIDTLNIPQVINGFTVTGIGNGAFASLESEDISVINIPETVTYIGDYAFEEITAKIDLGGTVTHLGEGAFMGCSSLKEISLSEGLEKIPFAAFSDCSSLSSIVIPEGVTLIAENAFKDCSSLLTAVLPQTVSAVENSAFHGCDALKAIFWSGTEETFNAIETDDKNECLTEAKLYIHSETEPLSDGDFWHFDEDGKPKTW